MDAYQFDCLMKLIKETKEEIIKKLEDIRCGIIDVETEVEKIRNKE